MIILCSLLNFVICCTNFHCGETKAQRNGFMTKIETVYMTKLYFEENNRMVFVRYLWQNDEK